MLADVVGSPYRPTIAAGTFIRVPGRRKWEKITTTPGWLFSRTLEAADWSGLEIVRDDVVDFVRELKPTDGSELCTLGSVSLA